MLFGQLHNSHIMFKQLAKALIRQCAYVQADLRLCLSHIPHCCKSHALAHFIDFLDGMNIPLHQIFTEISLYILNGNFNKLPYNNNMLRL